MPSHRSCKRPTTSVPQLHPDDYLPEHRAAWACIESIDAAVDDQDRRVAQVRTQAGITRREIAVIAKKVRRLRRALSRIGRGT